MGHLPMDMYPKLGSKGGGGMFFKIYGITSKGLHICYGNCLFLTAMSYNHKDHKLAAVVKSCPLSNNDF